MSKVVGQVTEEEKRAIVDINGHKNALEELLMILSPEEELYATARKDLEATMVKYQSWWDEQYQKYQWEKGDTAWRILFDTNEIIIE